MIRSSNLNRVSKLDIPTVPVLCEMLHCVYCNDGVCANPRMHKGNSDAMCHRMDNKDLLKILTRRRSGR